MSPLVYGLAAVIVVVLLLVGYMIFFTDADESTEEDEEVGNSNAECIYDTSNCSSYVTKTTCKAGGFAATDATCTALGYSKTATTAATITTTSAYCKGLSANIALFASNVAAYYNENTVVKKSTPTGASSMITIYEGQTNPNFVTSSAVKAWVASSNDVTKSITNGVTSIINSSKATALFVDAPKTFENLTPTMNIMFGLAAAPAGYTAPTNIWKNQLTDSDNNVWSTLDTTQLAAAVTEALTKLPGDSLYYC